MSTSSSQLEQLARRLPELRAEVVAKAATDAAFRADLTKSPQGTLEKEYQLPVGTLQPVKIQIFEETPGSIGILLPPAPAGDGDEISEEQLESISAGTNGETWAEKDAKYGSPM